MATIYDWLADSCLAERQLFAAATGYRGFLELTDFLVVSKRNEISKGGSVTGLIRGLVRGLAGLSHRAWWTVHIPIYSQIHDSTDSFPPLCHNRDLT